MLLCNSHNFFETRESQWALASKQVAGCKEIKFYEEENVVIFEKH